MRLLLGAAAALVMAEAAGRQTWNGCACKQTWNGEDGFVCNDYCCNPDNDFGGQWCMVEDIGCEDVDWGYCKESELIGATSDCVDSPVNWADSEGDTCKSYVDEQLCNSNGGYGWGWDSDWGTFFDFMNQGATAATACCGCGGGIRGNNAFAPTEQCTDASDWKDKDGDSCATYVARAWCNSSGFGRGWHTEWGTFTDFKSADGKTAFTACCACGGGTREGSDLLIARTTWNGCKCKKGWSDQVGVKCEGYCCNTDNDPNGEWCMVESEECEEFDWGYCRPLGALVSEGSSCEDDPPGWSDTEGDTCTDYKAEGYCNSFGGYGSGWDIKWGTFHNFMNEQRTAATACCSCGGGHSVWTPTLAETCQDEPNWKDKDGDDCNGYKTMAWCNENGMGPGWHEEWGSFDTFASNGLSATQACCHCGGGSRTRNFYQTVQVARIGAEVVVKEKPWVLPAGGVTMLVLITGCCMACCCVCRKKEIREQAADTAKDVAVKVADAVGPQKIGNRYNTVSEDL